jgi:hypothetical protein
LREIEGYLTMSMPSASRACAVLFATALLTGCFGAHLGEEAPANVRLQGIWKLNRAASEDPQKVIQALREEAQKKIRRAMNTPPPTPMDGGQGGGGGGRRRGGGGGGQTPDAAADAELSRQAGFGPGMPGPGADPLRNSPTMHTLREVLQRSDYVTIKQGAETMSIDYGTSIRRYTPGGRSVVSSENGVADQISGWKDKSYVINIRPQLGPAVVEEYSLSPDHKQLIVKTQIGPFELQKAKLTRVYDATSAVVPNSGPSNE